MKLVVKTVMKPFMKFGHKDGCKDNQKDGSKEDYENNRTDSREVDYKVTCYLSLKMKTIVDMSKYHLYCIIFQPVRSPGLGGAGGNIWQVEKNNLYTSRASSSHQKVLCVWPISRFN